MSEDNSGERAAKENKLLKMDSPKTLKSQNVKLNNADTNRRNNGFSGAKAGEYVSATF